MTAVRPRNWVRAVLVIGMATLVLDACSSATSDNRSPTADTSFGSDAVTAPPSQVTTTARRSPTHIKAVVLPSRLPQPVAREAVVALGATADRFLVAGGLVAGDQSTAATYVVDPLTGTVDERSALAVAVHDAAGVVARPGPMVVGGGNSSEQATVQVRRSSGWNVEGGLPEPRSDLSAVSTDRGVFAIGGYNGAQPAERSVLVLRQGHWQTFSHLPEPVRYAPAVAAGRAIWVFGGERSGRFLDTVQRIDLASGRAIIAAHLHHPLAEAMATNLDGRIVIAGGRTGGSRLSRAIWSFDPRTGAVRRAGRLPMPLADAAVAAGARQAFIVGGETPDLSDRVVRMTLT